MHDFSNTLYTATRLRCHVRSARIDIGILSIAGLPSAAHSPPIAETSHLNCPNAFVKGDVVIFTGISITYLACMLVWCWNLRNSSDDFLAFRAAWRCIGVCSLCSCLVSLPQDSLIPSSFTREWFVVNLWEHFFTLLLRLAGTDRTIPTPFVYLYIGDAHKSLYEEETIHLNVGQSDLWSILYAWVSGVLAGHTRACTISSRCFQKRTASLVKRTLSSFNTEFSLACWSY